MILSPERDRKGSKSGFHTAGITSCRPQEYSAGKSHPEIWDSEKSWEGGWREVNGVFSEV